MVGSRRVLLVVALLVATVAVVPVDQQKELAISDLTVLLPLTYSQSTVPYTLEAFNGCFKWTSTNPEIVKVKGVYGDGTSGAGTQQECSQRAVLSIQGTPSARSSTWIIAEDIASGRQLKCETFVDKIATMEITTTTRTISKDDYEMLELQAFDDNGNLFSSVRGLEMQWTITREEGEASRILKAVPFREAHMEIDEHLMDMENRGKQTTAVLVQAVDIGRVTVIATLKEVGYEDVNAASVVLSVTEPLQLHPAHPIYLVPGGAFQYHLQTFRKDTIADIPMPHPSYLWSTSHPNIASIDETGSCSAYKLGETTVEVQYANMPESKSVGVIHVVTPSYLTLTIHSRSEPDDTTPINWYLIAGHEYDLRVEVYDREGHRITNTDSLNFDVVLDEKSFAITKASSNRARFSLVALKEGPTLISGSLNFDRPITVQQEALITAPVHIEPSGPIVLPYLYDHPDKHQFTLRALGGSTEYNWKSLNPEIISVTAGVVTVQGKGVTEVVASCKKNPLNQESLVIKAESPTVLHFLPSSLEVQVGNSLELLVGLKGESGDYFHNCSAVAFNWKLKEPSIFSLLPASPDLPHTGTACTTQLLLALKEGRTTAKISLGDLSSESPLVSYPPLELIQPASKSSLVSLGSSMLIEFEGGPFPWHLEPSGHFVRVAAETPKLVDIVALSSDTISRHRYVVTCLAYSDQIIDIEVGNQPHDTLQFPAIVHDTLQFSCQAPAGIYLTSGEDEVEEETTACPDIVFSSSIRVLKPRELHSLPTKFKIRNNRTLMFNATIVDSKGRMFSNFTSLKLDWTSSDAEKISFLSSGQKSRLVRIGKETGKVQIGLSITGYETDQLEEIGLRRPPVLSPLQNQFEFQLFPNVYIFPSSTTVLNHPDNLVRLYSSGGSGFFHFTSNSSTVLELVRQERISATALLINPLETGVAVVTVVDVCLGGSEPAHSMVTVSDVATLNIRANDMIKIGSWFPLEVQAFDIYGKPFPAEQFRYTNFTFFLENNLVQMERESPDNYALYKIKGIHSGTERITVSSKIQSGVTVSSNPAEIYIFQDFQLTPRDLVIMPGVKFQVGYIGGPPSGAEISYTSSDSAVASIDRNGVVTGHKVGDAKISASCSATDLFTGKSMQVGQDEVKLSVQELQNIRIVGATRLITENEETMRVMGLHGETPFTFGTEHIDYEWTVEDPDIASVVPIYSEAKSTVVAESSFAVRVVGKSQGKTKINVKMLTSPPLPSNSNGLIASTSIQVIDRLRLISPAKLLLAPNTGNQIISNHDSKVVYQILDGRSSIEVDQAGNVLARKSGRAVILVQEDTEVQQTLVIPVSVKPYHQLQILPTSVNFEIPIGSSVQFHIKLRDDVGEEFSSPGNLSFSFELNKLDVASVQISDGRSIMVKGIRPGQAILHVFADQIPHLEDYVHIRVGQGIIPNNVVVHLGGTVQFSTCVKEPTRSQWTSENPKVLAIDSVSGVGVAKETGTTKIVSNSTTVTYTYGTVVTVDTIKVDTHGIAFLTDVNSEEYKFPITFYSKAGHLLESDSSVDHKIQLDCSIQESSWARSRPLVMEGHYFCLVTPGHHKTAPPAALTLLVTARDSSHSYSVDHRVSFPFFAGFVIRNREDPIRFIASHRTHVLEIHGDVDVIHSSEKRVVVEKKQSDPSTHSSSYTISVVDGRHPFDAKIEFLQHQTGQKDQVTLQYRAQERTVEEQPFTPEAAAASSPNSILWLLLVTFAVLCAGLVYTLTCGRKPTPPATPTHIRGGPAESPISPRSPDDYPFSASLSRPPTFQHAQTSPFKRISLTSPRNRGHEQSFVNPSTPYT